MRVKVTEEMIRDWADSSVTKNLLELVGEQITDLESGEGVICYHPFEPQRTQEVLAGLNGAVDTWSIVQELLGGDWEYFEEEESDGE